MSFERLTSWEFQSTHPVRGATLEELIPVDPCRFQSTHPVRGATTLALHGAMTTNFNPRTP